jgi:hypothetical protein
LQQKFSITFSFEHENPNIDATLKQIRGIHQRICANHNTDGKDAKEEYKVSLE